MIKKPKNCFTLIELLMVIAIIGLLASVVLVWLGNSQAKTRDTKRYGESNTLRTALELQYDDRGEYPEATDWIKIDEDAGFAAEMQPYLPIIPKDPLWGQEKETGEPYSYQYKSTEDQQGYKIHVEMETGEYVSYEVYSGGGSEIVYLGGFCGWSTYGECNFDEDCTTGGCSGEVCESEFDESVITKCVMRDCYDTEKYGVSCKCIKNKCQWSK